MALVIKGTGKVRAVHCGWCGELTFTMSIATINGTIKMLATCMGCEHSSSVSEYEMEGADEVQDTRRRAGL